MRKTLLTAAAALAATTALLAAEPHVERTLKLALGGAGDTLVIENDDQEIGETRQYFTESGKEVLITRTEAGRTIEFDGRTIEIGEDPEDVLVSGGGAHRMVIHREHVVDSAGGGPRAFAFHTEGGVEADGAHVTVLHRRSAAKHLEESGVLDDVDPETRERILATLRELEPGSGDLEWVHGLDGADVKVIRIDRREEIHEHEEE